MTPCRITGAADVAAITAKPYDDFIAAHSVIDALERVALRHAERNALAYVAATDLALPAEVWIHARFIADVRRAANLFAQLADGADARVAMLLPPIPQAHFTLWGAEAAGVVCPINFLLNSGHIAELIDAAQANILVALGPNPELDIWSRVPALRAACPRLKHVLAVGGAPDALDFDAQLRAMPGDRFAFARRPQRDDIAALFHTGGTTGAPKLAQHTHGNQLHAGLGRGTDVRDGRTRRDPQRLSAVPRGGLLRLRPVGAAVRRRGGAAARRWACATPAFVQQVLALRRARARHAAGHRADRDRGAARRRCGQMPTCAACAPAAHRRLAAAHRAGGRLRAAASDPGAQHPRHDRMRRRDQHRAVRARRARGFVRPAAAVHHVQATRADGTVCAPDEPGVLRVRGPNVGPGYTDARRNAGTLQRRRLADHRRHRPRRRRRAASSSPAAPRT